jgi:hypothetical protein
LFGVLAFACAAVLIERLWIGSGVPLWIDESFAAYFATRPSFSALLQTVRTDTNPPLYFVLAWLWPFKSDDGLRALSAVFTLTAATLPLVFPARLSAFQRAAWAALLLIWLPGQLNSLNARPGALLMLLATAQNLAFMRAMEKPDTRRALVWTFTASLAISTHYYAAVLGAAQGVAYLGIHRKAALKTWPALFGLLPSVGVAAWHLPYFSAWMQPGLVWYERLTPIAALDALLWTFQPDRLGAVALAVSLILCRFLKSDPRPSEVRIGAVANAAGLLFVLAVGMAAPIVTLRYLTPFAPGVLLVLVLLARAPLGYAVCAVAMLAFSGHTAMESQLAWRSGYGLEEPARFLTPGRPATVLVALPWVSVATLVGPAELSSVAERPFRQAGLATKARFVLGSSPERALFAQSTPFIWMHGWERKPGPTPPGWICRRTRQTMACLRAPTRSAAL